MTAAVLSVTPIDDLPHQTAGGEGRECNVAHIHDALPTRPLVICPAHGPADLTHVIGEMRNHHRLRVGYVRAQTKLTLQAKAFCRSLAGGDKDAGGQLFLAASRMLEGKGRGEDGTHAEVAFPSSLIPVAAGVIMPILTARAALAEPIKAHTRGLETLAGLLPVAAWANGVRGLGRLALGQIIAETGDLDLFANPGKVWKRMGLGLVDGQRQRRVTDVDLAIRMGYDAHRRSLMFVVGDGLIKLNQTGPYRTYYDAEKARQAALHPELSKMVCHMRAHRHMTKKLLKDMWQEWTGRGVEWGA